MVTIGISFLAAVLFVVTLIVVAKSLYRIVPINEAHIRVMMTKTKIFSSRTQNSAYWFIPIITKLHKLPLSNLAIPVNDVKLNDKDMAKFVTDIMCFVNIENLELAVERLTLTDVSSDLGFSLDRLQEDLKAILESICRTVATKQTIIDIYMNREMLDTAITKEVESVFPKWGLRLVDLELKDIKDAADSSIIHDIERKIAAQKERDARVKEAEMMQEAKIKEAEATEEFRKREVLRDRAIGIQEQEALLEVSRQKALANEQEVEALRKLEVGKAEVKKQMIEQNAMAEKIKVTLEAEAYRTRLQEEAEGNKFKLTEEGEGKSQEIKRQGQAEADIILAKKLAEAEGIEKVATAMRQYDDIAIRPQLLEIMKDVQLGKYKYLAESLSQADLKLIMSGDKSGSLFGLDFNADTGANLEQFMDESGFAGMDVSAMKEVLKKVQNMIPRTIVTEKGNGGQ